MVKKEEYPIVRNGYCSVFPLADGTSARFPIMVKKASIRGPRVVMVAALHGEEVVGVEVIHEVFHDVKLARGWLCAIPVANTLGFCLGKRFVPYGESTGWGNLNRSFPGGDDGPTGKIAARIFRKIVSWRPDVVLDFHADAYNSIAYTLGDRLVADLGLSRREIRRRGLRMPPSLSKKRLGARIQELMEAFGVTACMDDTLAGYAEDDTKSSLSGALVNYAHLPAITVELGGPRVVKEEFVKIGVAGVKNVLKTLGMLGEEWEIRADPSKIVASFPMRTEAVNAPEKSGIVSYKVLPGEEVKSGQTIATIEDFFGNPFVAIKAPLDGFVLSLGYHIVATPGAVIAILAVRDI